MVGLAEYLLSKKKKISMSQHKLSKKRFNENAPNFFKIYLYCEGESEQEYFKEIKRQKRENRIKIIINNNTGVPTQLANKAITERRKNGRGTEMLKNDIVYLVFDRDTHKEMSETIRDLEAVNIKWVITNPKFELWILLHFKDVFRYMTGDEVDIELAKVCTWYDKNMKDLFSRLTKEGSEKLNNAIRRSKSLITLHNKNNPGMAEYLRNPLSTLYTILELLF